MRKRAAALGSALPDPVRSADAVSPVPSPVVANKTAPGRRGPLGLSPRTTYSRVNSGPPPVPDVGAGAQKSVPPRGAEFLPAKTAQSKDFNMFMAERPTLQEMLKAAMDGTASKVDVTAQAIQQQFLQTGEEPEKIASDESPEHFSTEQISKLAGALDFIATGFLKEADQGNIQMPGKGPQALQVLESARKDDNIDAGEGGHATAQHLPPKDPPVQKEEVQTGKANTGLQTNDDMSHPEQPRDPWANERASLQNAVSKQAAVSPRNVRNVQELLRKARGGVGKAMPGRGGRGFERDVVKGTPAKETGAGRVLQLLKGERAKAMRQKAVTKRQTGAARKETAKTWGARGAAAAVPAAGAAALASKKKEAQGDVTLAERAGASIGRNLPAWGTGVGALYGASPGAIIGAGMGGRKGALIGAGLGALGGGLVGRGFGHATKGIYRGATGTEAGKTAGVDVELIRNIKLAEDAIYPSNIQGGPQVPPAAVPAEQGMPPVPSDVRSQQKLVGSNQAAIEYTKGQAKENPKGDVAKVLNEPPLSAKTDKVLQKTLAHTGEAGVKISSMQKMASDSTRVAAARALLSRMQKEAEASCPSGSKNKKEKSSMMGAAPTTPSSATGVTAATMG